MKYKNKNKYYIKLKPTPFSWKRFYLFWFIFTVVLSLMEKIGYDKYTGNFYPKSWGEILFFLPLTILISVFIVLTTGVAREKREKDIYEEIYKKIEEDNRKSN